MATNSRTAVVLGATGLVGGYVVQHLLENNNYTKVDVLVRRKMDLQHSKLAQHVVDFKEFDKYRSIFSADDIYCCIGTTIKQAGSKEAFRAVDYDIAVKAAQLAAENAAQQYLLVSSLGANKNSSFFYMRTKGEVEEDVQKFTIPSIHIFQPSMLLGPRKEYRFGEAIGQGFMKLVDPLMIGSLRKYRAIHAETVAKAMIKTALQNTHGKFTYKSDAIEDMLK